MSINGQTVHQSTGSTAISGVGDKAIAVNGSTANSFGLPAGQVDIGGTGNTAIAVNGSTATATVGNDNSATAINGSNATAGGTIQFQPNPPEFVVTPGNDNTALAVNGGSATATGEGQTVTSIGPGG